MSLGGIIVSYLLKLNELNVRANEDRDRMVASETGRGGGVTSDLT